MTIISPRLPHPRPAFGHQAPRGEGGPETPETLDAMQVLGLLSALDRTQALQAASAGVSEAGPETGGNDLAFFRYLQTEAGRPVLEAAAEERIAQNRAAGDSSPGTVPEIVRLWQAALGWVQQIIDEQNARQK